MIFYKNTSDKTEYAKVKLIHNLNCVAALGTHSTECVNQQTV